MRWASGYFHGGDKRVDLVAVWNDGGSNTLTVRRSTGSAFVVAPGIASHWGGWMPDSQWLPGDFDADGATDMAVAWDDGGSTSIAVYRGGARGFTGYGHAATQLGGWGDIVH